MLYTGHAKVGGRGVTPPLFAETVSKSLGLLVIIWLVGNHFSSKSRENCMCENVFTLEPYNIV